LDDINPEPWLQFQGPHAATVSWGTNRVDAFIRGTDGNVYRKYTSDDTTWSPAAPNYDPLGSAGGGFAGQAGVASWGSNRLDLFGVGYDGNLYHKWYDSGPNWSSWENLSQIVGGGIPGLIGTPSAVSYAGGAFEGFRS